MKILSMTATFGKLDGQTLEFDQGLNVITAPNEWGKSTWCAFLTAMLYGIDTKSRSTQDRLAEKEKYMPWSGKPMEGSIRLIYQGRDITIQRRSKGRTPMGEFKAFETETGLPVRELTRDNCGQTLVGVERSVFQRTGFIRFSDLPVSQDDALRRRLNALVTTGDETGSADLLAKKLKELKNKCRYNRSGLIPEVQSQIGTLQGQLRERQELETQLELLERRISQAQEQQQELEIHRSTMAYYQAQEDRRRVEQAAENAKAAQAVLEELEEQCASLPGRGELLSNLQEGQSQLDQPDPAENTKAPSGFRPGLLAILAVLAVIGGWILREYSVAMIGCAVAAVGFSVAALLSGRALGAHKEKMEEAAAAYARRQEELKDSMAKWQRQLALWEDLDRARESARQTKDQLQALLSMARSASKPERPDKLDLSREETMEQLGKTGELLQRCRMQQAQIRGRMESLPERQTLQSQINAAQLRLSELETTWLALDYGQKALEAAMQELQRRFAPRISRRAGQFLNRLTLGRYNQLTIDNELTIESAQESETTLRTALWRSDGTADQMYLALRLAVWEALTPDAPLILDDALVRFDADRLDAAMTLLQELSKNHQILLFTCQEREREYVR